MSSPTRLLLTKFISVFAAGLLNSLAGQQADGGAAMLAALAARNPGLLAAPVAFTEVNLTPASGMPISLQALTVGFVLVLVLGLGSAKMAASAFPLAQELEVAAASGRAANLADGIRGPLTPHATLLARSVASVCGTCAIGAVWSGLVVGVAGSTYTGGTTGGLQLWGLIWLLGGGVAFFLAGLIELVGQTHISVLFLPVAYFNSLGGWSLDLADADYRFFQYSPLYHAVRVARHILFSGAIPSSAVEVNVGALVAWAVISIAFYAGIALFGKPWLQARLGITIRDVEGGYGGKGDGAGSEGFVSASLGPGVGGDSLTLREVLPEETAHPVAAHAI
jgi:hypothetical protein